MFGQMLNQAMALHQAGRVAEAEALYRQVIAGGVADPQVQHYYGAALYQQQKLPEALVAVEAALKRNPGSVDSLMLKGAILQALGRASEAQAAFSDVVAVAPRNAEAWYNLGVAETELGRRDQALEAFDRALSVQPMPQAWNNRSALLREMDRPAEALDSADRALSFTRDFVPALYNRALALWDLKRTQDTLAALERLLTVDARVADAWNSRAAVLLTLERYEDAGASAEQALALRPDSFSAWMNRGHALGGLRRYEPALESFDRALALNPRSIEALVKRGEVLGLMRRFEEALAADDAVLALDPARAVVWLNRGVALQMLQRFDEALASIDRSLALAADDPHALLARSKVLCEMGRIDEGFAILARRGELVYGGPDAPPTDGKAPPEPKLRHDEEQRAWLAARGVASPLGFRLDGGDRLPGPAVNPANREIVARQWAASDPQIVVIDELLTPAALEGLRRFCLGSTVWRKAYRRGYLGAFQEHGFACPLLAQIAQELEEVFPTVIDGHGLVTSWAFKYDSRLDGIAIHADQAAVNVNFWITPQEANLNPESGGMVIWDKAAPEDWEITRYNGDDDAVRAFLAQAEARSITVPYRENRAVIFDSDLFHETDRIEFREGYENRRVNVTMLYGRRSRLHT